MSTEHGDSTETPAQRDYRLVTLKIVSFRVPELKELCKSTGLAVYGRKQEIQDRLFQFAKSLFASDKKTEIVALRALMAKLAFGPGIPPLNQLVSAIRLGALTYQQVLELVTRYEVLAAEYMNNRIYSAALPEGVNPALTAFHIISNNAVLRMPSSRPPHHANSQFSAWHEENRHHEATAAAAAAAAHQNINLKPHYTSSLFYTLRHPVGLSHTLAPSRGRAFKEFVVGLPLGHVEHLRQNPTARLFLFCCTGASAAIRPAVILYPPIEIYVNGILTKQSIRGLKGKTGSARPADLTPHITISERPSTVRVVYSDASDRFIVDCYIVDTHTPDTIMTLVMGKPHISYASTTKMLQEENERSAHDDIVVENVPLSLRCPVTYARIKYPVKSIQCDHVQCFDGLSFLTMQERIPVWQCPVCSRLINENLLAVSDYLQNILDNTTDEIDTVVLNADGSWTPVRESDDAAKKDDDDKHTLNIQTRSDSVPPAAAAAVLVDDIIEIISLDSDSEPETEPQPQPQPQPQPVSEVATEPDTNTAKDISMEIPENLPPIVAQTPVANAPVVPENTTLIDTTMNDETLLENMVPSPTIHTSANETAVAPAINTPEEQQKDDTDAFSDEDELVLACTRRMRVHLLPEPGSPSIEAHARLNSDHSLLDGTNVTSEASASAIQTASVAIFTPSTTASNESVARSLEDVPISQYLAQRNNQNKGSSPNVLAVSNVAVEKDVCNSTCSPNPATHELGEKQATIQTNTPSYVSTGIPTAKEGTVSTPDSIAPTGQETMHGSSTLISNHQESSVPKPDSPSSVQSEEGAQNTPNNASSTPDAANDVDMTQEPRANEKTAIHSPENTALNISVANRQITKDPAQQKTTASLPVNDPSISRIRNSSQANSHTTTERLPESAGGNQESPATQVTIETEARQIPQAFDKPATRAFGDVNNTIQPSSLTHNVTRHDPLIPVVWQNKENHPKGLERIQSSKVHHNRTSSVPQVSSPNLSNVAQAINPQGSLVLLSANAKEVATAPITAKPGNDISIIKAIHDQISRTCSPRPDSIAHADDTLKIAQNQLTHKTSLYALTIREPSALLPSVSNGNSTATTLRTLVESQNLALNNDPRPNITTDVGRKVTHNSPTPLNNTLQTEPVISKFHVAGQVHNKPANLEFTRVGDKVSMIPSGPGADGNRTSRVVPSDSEDMEFALAHTRGQYDNDLGRYLSDLRINHAQAAYRARQKYMELQTRMATAGYAPRQLPNENRYPGTNSSSSQFIRGPQLATWNINSPRAGQPEQIQQVNPQAGQIPGAIRTFNPTHQQNVKHASQMIHAYQRSLSESVVGGGGPVNPYQAKPGLMRHTSLQYPGSYGTNQALKPGTPSAPGTPVSPYQSHSPTEIRSYAGPYMPQGQIQGADVTDSTRTGMNPNPELAARQGFGRGPPLQSLNRSGKVLGVAKIPSIATGRINVSDNREVQADGNGARYSKTAFDKIVEKNTLGHTVRGILGIELSKDAFQPTRETTPLSPPSGQNRMSPRPSDVATDNVDQTAVNANTTFSPLNDLIEDMAIRTPTSKKRTISGDESTNERTWNKRLSRQGSTKSKFDPSAINQSDIIEIDD